jgi:hypothetical protein
VTKGDFGTVVWDAEAAKQVMAEYGKRGNPIAIDVEHNSNPDINPNYDPNAPPAGGGYVWLKLDAKGALWLDPIQWSDHARYEIESGSRRTISPDWDYDPKTNRPVRLNKISLVQSPGTYAIGLVASARVANGAKKMDLAFILAALKAANQGENANPAIDALIAEIEKAMSAAPADEEPVVDPDPDMAGGVPEKKEEDVAKLFARAMAAMTKKPAPAKGVSLEAIRAEARAAAQATFREEGMKAQLIASAKASPLFTEAFGQELQLLPVAHVKRIVHALPKPAPTQTATASAQPNGVKVAPLPGAEPEKVKLSAAEQASLELIERAGKTRDDLIEEAHAAASANGKPKIAEDGSYSFSALSQMTRRTPAAPKGN